MEAIKLGIIGAGLAVRKLHWPALERLRDRYRIVAVADVDEAAAQATAKLVGAERTMTDGRALLALDEVEAVLLSLPIHLTAPFALEAARAGKHLVMEKPLGSNLQQARQLVDQLARLPATVLVAENYRYRPDLLRMRQLIRDGRIGDLLLVEVRSLAAADTTNPDNFSSTPWRHDNQYRGGPVLDAGVHHAAALRMLGGEVEWVQAFAKNGGSQLGGSTTVSLHLRFRGGALGAYLFSVLCHEGRTSPEVKAYGTTGTLVTADEGLQLLRVDAEPETIEVESSDNGYYGEFVNFAAALREGAPIVATPQESLRDMELILRGLDSAEQAEVLLL